MRRPVQNSSSTSVHAISGAGVSNAQNIDVHSEGSEPMDQASNHDGGEGRNGTIQPSSINLMFDIYLKCSVVYVSPYFPLFFRYESSGSRYLKLNGHQAEVFICQWSPIQNQLVTGSGDGMCRLWGLGGMTEEKWQIKADVPADSQFVNIFSAVLPHSSTQGEKYKDVTSITWRLY